MNLEAFEKLLDGKPLTETEKWELKSWFEQAASFPTLLANLAPQVIDLSQIARQYTGDLISENFESGASGYSITAADGNAEFNNITARGMIKTAVFKKDVVSAVGGTLIVLDADVLASDMTALDDETLTIQGNTTFVAGDILRMKDATYDEWLLVVDASAAPTYTVLRDRGAISSNPGWPLTDSNGNPLTDSSGNPLVITDLGSYAVDSNPAWKKGQAVVKYGPSGSGGVQLVSGSDPEMSIFTHDGNPWTSLIKSMLFKKALAQMGANVASPSTTGFNFFATAQTYNGEAFGAGDILIGDNSSGKGNLFWDASAGVLYFRTGTTALNSISTGAVQAVGAKVRRSTNQTIVTDGALHAVSFDTVTYDDLGFYNAGSPTRLTIPTGYGGRYRVGAWVGFSLNANDKIVLVYVNNTYSIAGDEKTGNYFGILGEAPLNDGDYIELQIQGPAPDPDLTVAALNERPSLWLERVR